MTRFGLKKIDFILMLLLFIFSLMLRLPNIDIYLDTDGADYAIAAQKGFLVNYLDLGSRPTLDFIKQGVKDRLIRGDTDLWAEDYKNGDIAAFRHYHPPLIMYFMSFFMFLFGTKETFLRLTPLLFGALTCSLLYFICLKAFLQDGRFMGVAVSVMLAITPLHAQVSKYVSCHSTYMFWEVMTIFLLSQAYKHDSNRYLYLSFTFLALAFLTLEYAPLLLVTISISFLIIKNKWLSVSRKEIVLSTHLILCFTLILAMLILIWPASLLKLSMLKNYVVYSAPVRSGIVHFRYGSWYYFYYDFFMKNMMLSTLILVSLFYTGNLILKKKLPIYHLPFVIYPMLLFMVNLRVGAVKPAYISHMLPFLLLPCAMVLSRLFYSRAKKVNAIPVIILCFLLLTNIKGLSEAYSGSYYMGDVIAFFDEKTKCGSSVLVAPEGIVPAFKYYLKDQNVEFYYAEKDELEVISKRIENNKFDFFIFKGSERDVKNLEIYTYLNNRFNLVKIINVRNGKAKLRIYMLKSKFT